MRKKLINSNNKYLFFYPGNINQKTGGYIYEKNILNYSKANNIPIKFISLSDNYPYPNSTDLNLLSKLVDKESSKTTLIFDGLVFEGILKLIDKLSTHKIIALIHHPLYLEFKGKKSISFFKSAKKIYKKTNQFIVTSSGTKKLLSKAFKIEPSIISIVEPGIDKLKIFKKNKSSIKHFLTCGSLIERKNYDYLIKEIKNIENIIINIVGNTSRENDYTKKLIDYINKNNLSAKVILHGQISQFKLDKLYSQCDFYISTSKYEGFGMALANASISKLPIISFKTPTIMKTIGNKGVIYFDNYKKGTLERLIKNNCFSDKKYQFLKSKLISKNFLTTNQSAKLFIKVIKNA